MFPYIILLFTILPALELAVLIQVGGHIGAGNTILIIISTGIFGAYLARIQGFLAIQNIQARLQQGIMPTEEMFDGLMIFCGGILLLTPGFITDILGLGLLIPAIRIVIKAIIKKKIQTSCDQNTISQCSFHEARSHCQDYEDADLVE